MHFLLSRELIIVYLIFIKIAWYFSKERKSELGMHKKTIIFANMNRLSNRMVNNFEPDNINAEILKNSGIEPEDGPDDHDIITPFDPKKVEIAVEQITIYGLAARLEDNAINLMPEFQRQGNLWNTAKMSQLIESILIRLPLPAMYMDVADDQEWVVVDGLQRLSAIKKFMVDKELKLNGLEFLKELEGKGFDDLDRIFQRRIQETNITLFKIKKGTPRMVLTSLFHRINTGGTKLTAQEIRHALNQGRASHFLKDTSEQKWFKEVIKVSPKRMLDKELIVRFTAFYRKGYKAYTPSLQQFLDEEMMYLNKSNTTDSGKLEELCKSFKKSLALSNELFGEKAFSKAMINVTKSVVINRSLFETTTVNFAYLNNEEVKYLKKNKELFVTAYKELMKNVEFDNAITANTNHSDNVRKRHEKLNEVIKAYTVEV